MNLSVWFHPIVIIIATILGTSSFWAMIDARSSRKKATTMLMMGLTYDRLMKLGLDYIDRGEITRDELEEYYKYFFEPYKTLGGNGIAERMWDQVRTLPFCQHSRHEEIFRNHELRTIANVTVNPRRNQEAHASSE